MAVDKVIFLRVPKADHPVALQPDLIQTSSFFTLGMTTPSTDVTPKPYCSSRFRTVRRQTREVMVGNVGVGGSNPIRVQSMTTTLTEDVEATVRQTLELAEAGCEIVRITAPTTKSARALKEIVARVRAAKVDVPLVADIHFAPRAAMEAAEHMDKIRINPGNYVDTKKFAVREYSDAAYQAELDRLYEGFTPIVLKCKELGRSMRIGTNHGSLSDRIMNRYGDTPEGMVESALEFIRIAESHRFHEIILSMKASNPKVMIEAYRLAAERMALEGMHYPLHLGVTEAGDGEDGRVKSAVGIGSLLYDGLGDTIRVSLTEDPIREVPVGNELARRAERLWATGGGSVAPGETDSIDPYHFQRRPIARLGMGRGLHLAADQPPTVITRSHRPLSESREIIQEVCSVQARFKESKIEGLLLSIDTPGDVEALDQLGEALHPVVPFVVVETADAGLREALIPAPPKSFDRWWIILPSSSSSFTLEAARANDWGVMLDVGDGFSSIGEMVQHLRPWRHQAGVLTLSQPRRGDLHGPGHYRLLAEALRQLDWKAPIWIRNTASLQVQPSDYVSGRLIEASALSGSLLCDGIGDLISLELEPDPSRATVLAYNILQGSRARVSRTEYVACPSCGRTLFDLQSTTRKIRARTEHLKGVTIAIMGCIVNGPGEMADADFGYVGGAPGKVNLYVGKSCVKVGIPAEEAVDRLIDLIREQGKWVEPEAIPSEESP